MITSFAFYYFEYVVNRPGFMSVFLPVIGAAGFIGTIAATWVGIRVGKRNAYWIPLILSAVIFLSAYLFEPNAWTLTVVFGFAVMVGSISVAMTTVLFTDTAVYGEWKTGENIQAFTMSLLVLPIKLSLLIRTGIVTVGFAAIGYSADITPTLEVVNGINSIMIYAPAIAAALAAVTFYFGYKIDEKEVQKMQEEIAAR